MSKSNGTGTSVICFPPLSGIRPKPCRKKREEIWLSDLGKAYIDRCCRLNGVPYTNPATGKDLITFFLGNQIEQGLVGMLTTCGIAHTSQDRVEVKTEGCLPVVGKSDLFLEVDDWKKVVCQIDEMIAQLEGEEKPQRLIAKKEALKRIVAQWQERYPMGLRKTVFEVKSINSRAFTYNRRNGGLSNAYPHHRLQLYTYLKGLGIEEGHIIYVAKDTGWIEEVVIKANAKLEAEWQEDVQTMSRYYLEDIRPPLEPLMVEGKKNWRATYSRYYDMLYGEQSTPFVQGRKEKS